MTQSNNKEQAPAARSLSSSWWSGARNKPMFWVVVLGALLVGFLMRGGGGGESQSDGHAGGAEEAGSAAVTTWTCSMHPQIKLPDPGQCPICFMDLIPVAQSEDEDEDPRVLSMSETAKQLARVVTAPVERRFAQSRVMMVGKVNYDETSLAYIAAWIPGRLDRLFVDYTGIEVSKGDHMVSIYSPELLSAQEELLQALEALKGTENSGLRAFRETSQATVASVRSKLRLWGLTDSQIKEIEERGTATDHVTIYAPIGGVVVHKNALEGSYVQTGTRIYTIADLSQVWLELEAYESDLMWLRYGQSVTFETEALPGEKFHGRIAFIDPILDARTRTVRVRVNVDNRDRRLKPGMFVRATVLADVAASGLVTDSSLAGKWICPMHPDMVKDAPADCNVCGMPLVTTESLGYVSISKEQIEPPLVIPASAPLITGKRAVVYVELPDRDKPTYEGREIVLGPRAGDFYLVESGLEEGESVVVNGAFKIDSELQIRAGPSMMSPDGGAPPVHQHGDQAAPAQASEKATPPAPLERVESIPPALSSRLAEMFSSYFALHRALADDAEDDARDAMKQLSQQAEALDVAALTGDARAVVEQARNRIAETVATEAAAGDWVGLRTRFEVISRVLIDLDYAFGHIGPSEYFISFCPMAFDNKGAYWLQNTEEIANPYFGQSMSRCGSVTDRIQPMRQGSHD